MFASVKASFAGARVANARTNGVRVQARGAAWFPGTDAPAHLDGSLAGEDDTRLSLARWRGRFQAPCASMRTKRPLGPPVFPSRLLWAASRVFRCEGAGTGPPSRARAAELAVTAGRVRNDAAAVAPRARGRRRARRGI